jgi:lipopolysaccharide transport system permease protein
MLASLFAHRGLTATLTRREIASRYRGSTLGILWSVLTPLLLLAVYTFVFSVVFVQPTTAGTGSRAEFALMLYAGLIVFNLFAECLQRAPTLILTNANYVKKVVFPLDVLPVVTIGAAAFHLAINVAVWTVFHLAAIGLPPVTMTWLPFVLAPLLLMTLGCAWLLAALGVYVRDIGQLIGVAITVLMFLSPIFFRVEAMPAAYRWVLYASPVTVPVEQAREVMMWGRHPDGFSLPAYAGAALLMAWLGFYCFQKTRRGFADVL